MRLAAQQSQCQNAAGERERLERLQYRPGSTSTPPPRAWNGRPGVGFDGVISERARTMAVMPLSAATIGAAIPAVGLHVHRRNLVLGTAIFPNGVRTMIER